MEKRSFEGVESAAGAPFALWGTMKPLAHHVVARAHPFLNPLRQREACADLWRRLRAKLPKIAACVLMPNHLHLLKLGNDPCRIAWDLGVELRAWTQRFSPRSSVWSPIPDLRPIPDLHHLKRQIRYVHLNPCRAGLARDPLEWEWSTHRDLLGLVTDPWPEASFIRECFRSSEAAHAYISGDPSVKVGGTPMVCAFKPGMPVMAGTAVIYHAAAIARREGLELKRGPTRDLAVQVCEVLQAKPDPAGLRMSRLSWSRAVGRPHEPAHLQAVLSLLADLRCRPDSAGLNETKSIIRPKRVGLDLGE